MPKYNYIIEAEVAPANLKVSASIPDADDIYYDLSDINTLKDQCKKAKDTGIDAFGYWHYWFGNNFKTLEKVQEMHLVDKSIDLDFFLIN